MIYFLINDFIIGFNCYETVECNMYEELEKFLSKERLEPYLLKCNNDKEQAIKLYNLNINISKSLYPLFSYFEILLRNSCNNMLKKEIGDEWYFNNILMSGNNPERGQKTINKIQESIEKIHKRKREKNIVNYVIKNGDIISNFEFGFWSNLFNANYEHKMWRPYLQHIFKDFKRKELYKKIETIRELRNRIFHYEPIIFDTSLEEKYKSIISIIAYITKDNICNYIDKLNDFKENYFEYKKTRAVL